MNEGEQAWEEYRDALEKCVVAAKLAAFHTEEAAKAVEKASQSALLAVYHVREYIKEARAIQEALTGGKHEHLATSRMEDPRNC